MRDFFTLKSSDEIMHNMYVKVYPNGRVEALVCDKRLFREAGWELASDKRKAWERLTWWDYLTDEARAEFEYAELERSAKRFDDSNARARRRARSAVRDIAYANDDMDMFVTFTLDAAKIDRYDVGEITKKLNIWLDNRVRRNGLKYVLVPELHKDGAVHFHGLVNAAALSPVDSGTLTKGGARPRKPRGAAARNALLADGWQVVYNLPEWTYGFSTGIYLYGERGAAVNYTTKYIEKTTEKVGGRWYYSGGALERPAVYFEDCDSAAFFTEHADGMFETDHGWRFCAATIEEGFSCRD